MVSTSAAAATRTRDIVVVGASAGGVQTLQALVRALPEHFPATLLVIVHISPTAPSMLPSILTAAGPLPATHAVDHERFERRHI